MKRRRRPPQANEEQLSLDVLWGPAADEREVREAGGAPLAPLAPEPGGRAAGPSNFFSELGEQAATPVEDLTFDLAGDDPPGETYLQKVGRLQMARVRAEEMVLPELVLLPPEPGLDAENYPDLDEEETQGPA